MTTTKPRNLIYVCTANIVDGHRVRKGAPTKETGGTPTIIQSHIKRALAVGKPLIGKKVKVYYEVTK